MIKIKGYMLFKRIFQFIFTGSAVLLMLLAGLQFSCENSLKNIGEYQLVEEMFDSREIADLDKIITFFSMSICETENLSTKDLQNCYNSYFERLKRESESGDIEIGISIENQRNMIKDLNMETFNQIWGYGKVWKKNSDTLNIMGIKYTGKYALFLKEFGKENIKVRNYYERLEKTGTISPSMFADILVSYSDFDIRDERVKLLIAIHYLTLNEKFERINKL